MKLRIELENFKSVFACVCFNIAMTIDRPSFASIEAVEIDKNYSLMLPRWKSLCQVTSHNQRGRGKKAWERGESITVAITNLMFAK